MVSTAYHYYLSTYARQKPSRYDTHKKQELKDIYNRMVTINKRSPIYMIDLSEKAQHYAIDLKESSRYFRNTLLETSGSGNSKSAFEERGMYSSDESVLSVVFTGQYMDEMEEGIIHRIYVDQLAKPQVNTGDYVPSDRLDLPPGQYAFELFVAGSNYEFQYHVREDSTNLKIQEKLARLINRSAIGLYAEVLKDDNGSSALCLTAEQSGFIKRRGKAFEISDHMVDKLSGSVRLFGMDNITQPPTNARYIVDDISHTSPHNSFTLDKKYAITLKGTSEPGQEVEIGMRRSVDTIIKSVQDMTDSYNQMHDLASSETSISFQNRLLRDLNYLSQRFKTTLEGNGVLIEADGHLRADESLITQGFEDGSLESNASQLVAFRDSLLRQLDQISLNPMDYMSKKLIAYPNPVHSYPSIYQTSLYSGMIFNGFI